MGWTYTFRQQGESHLDWFRREWRTQDESGERLLALTSVGTTCYGALRAWHSDDVVGIVILTRWAPKDVYNFGYKEMDEGMGPYYYDCPERILDLLTPPTSDGAAEWRAKCREQIEKRKARPRISKGTTIEFSHPIHFTDGSDHRLFTYESRNRFRTGKGGYAGYLVRITDWAKREYVVVP